MEDQKKSLKVQDFIEIFFGIMDCSADILVRNLIDFSYSVERVLSLCLKILFESELS